MIATEPGIAVVVSWLTTTLAPILGWLLFLLGLVHVAIGVGLLVGALCLLAKRRAEDARTLLRYGVILILAGATAASFRTVIEILVDLFRADPDGANLPLMASMALLIAAVAARGLIVRARRRRGHLTI